MKAKIINTTDFDGIYTIDYLLENIELTSDWILTELLPSNEIVIPKWNGSEWFEGGSNDYLRSIKEEKAIQIDLDYTAKISLLMNKHVEKYIIDGTEIPLIIIEKRNELRQECNDKIGELGISDFTYRQRIIGL